MTRALLVAFVVGSVVSLLCYAGARTLSPDALDRWECEIDGREESCAAASTTVDEPSVSGQLLRQANDYLAPLVRTNNFYGVVYVAQRGRVLLNEGYGSASVELGVPHSSESVFHIASVSKPITAAAILLLQERGLVDLDAPLSRILPDYPNGDRLSLHHLLLHTSGIPDVNALPAYLDLSHGARTPDDLVGAFRDIPLLFEPGVRFSYSNSNYNLLALVIERVSGKTYGEFVSSEIFTPLGMGHTGHPVRDQTIVPHKVGGYSPVGRSDLERAPWIDWTVKTGNGSLYSTAADLARWVEGFFGGKVLSPAALEIALAPRLHDIGIDSMRGDLSYVWSIGRHLDRQKVWFAGRSPGYSAAISYFPDEALTVVVLSNTFSLATTQIADALAAMVFDAPYDTPQISDAPLPPSTTRRWVGTYQFGDRAPVPNMKMTVVEDNGRLSLEPGFERMQRSALLPLTDSTFILRNYWMSLEFEAEQDEPATALTLFGARAERVD